MPRKKMESVRSVALAADLDLDEALVILWDAGYLWLSSPDDVIPHKDLRAIRGHLELPTLDRETRVSWWQELVGLDFEELSSIASQLGVDLSPRSKRLPKGAIRKFRAHFGENFASEERSRDEIFEFETSVVCEPFEFEQVGSVHPRRYLTEEEVGEIHNALVAEFQHGPDPIFPPGIKSSDLLSSALTRPQTGYSDENKYLTVEMAGAAMLHSIIQNHPFFNGNKRTGFVSLLAFLDGNGYQLECEDDEIYRFLLRLSSHKLVQEVSDTSYSDREVVHIAKWIRAHSHQTDTGEREMTWLKLKHILLEFDCEFHTRRGSKIEITRTYVDKPTNDTVSRKSKVPFGGDGRWVHRDMIHKIRRDLDLDEDNSYDSYAFYGGRPVGSLISQYRSILKRLAKV